MSGSQPQEGFWNDVASLDFDAVAKSVHAMQPSCQPGNVAESDKAEVHQEAGGNVSPGADAGTGDLSHHLHLANMSTAKQVLLYNDVTTGKIVSRFRGSANIRCTVRCTCNGKRCS